MKRKRRLPPRVLRHLRPCPDCAASFVGLELHHEPTCPLSGAEEAVCDADRQYFEAHPEVKTVVRPISDAELQTLGHIDPDGRSASLTHVHVTRMPFGRARVFCTNADDSHSMILDADNEAAS